MNKNLNNFTVYRTFEGTIIELTCAVLFILSLACSILLLDQNAGMAKGMLVSTVICGISTLLGLVLTYAPHTFNIPDDSPEELYWHVIRFIRIVAVLTALLQFGLSFSALLGVHPLPVLVAYVLAFIVLLVWYAVRKSRIAKQKSSSDETQRDTKRL